MNILSDPQQDVRNATHQPGGYEWWYFDGLSEDERYSFVIIFYEGNPFSTRYNARLMDGDLAMPTQYPAISISIYEQAQPIYYSFTEFKPQDCHFDEEKPIVKVGSHSFKGEINDDNLRYTVLLDETLPCGDAIEAELTFISPNGKGIFTTAVKQTSRGHLWNLVQPRAQVRGNILVQTKGEEAKQIHFRGHGYHDHNTGQEPMHKEFTDWYWGRFHFNFGTLVYYVMNRREGAQHQAWLISKENSRILTTFEEIDLTDKSLTLFGLKTARKIGLRSDDAEIQIQQHRLLDNGPFYQRYQSEAYLRISGEDIVESKKGITEYIYPERINARLFWPFVDMRIRYMTENPHWVQQSKTLYRWTW